jgi:hypothetical protein
MGLRRLPIGPAFNHCRLSFKQFSFIHTARVLLSSNSIVCLFSIAFPICCFPPRLSAKGRLDDPRTFLLVLPGCTRDTVMRDMAHNPQRDAMALQPKITQFPRSDKSVSIPSGMQWPFSLSFRSSNKWLTDGFNPQRDAMALQPKVNSLVFYVFHEFQSPAGCNGPSALCGPRVYSPKGVFRMHR